MNKLICFLLSIGIICFSINNIFAIDMSTLMNKVKQNVKPSQDANSKEKIQRQQVTGNNQNKNDLEMQEVHRQSEELRNKDNQIDTSSITVIDEGVFCVEQGMITPVEEGKPFTIFDIPLNMPIQDVMDVLKEKNIINSIIDHDDSTKSWATDNSKTYPDSLYGLVNNCYTTKGITDQRRENALKVVSEKRIKFFSFNYGSQKYYLKPISLFNILGDKEVETPVFDKYYENYNSIFTVTCERGKDLPEQMQLQDVFDVTISFASIAQNEPKSFNVSLGFNNQSANPKLVSTLNRKYGYPTFYYIPATATQFSMMSHDSKEMYAAKIEYLKKKSKKSVEISQEESAYNDIVKYLRIGMGQGLGSYCGNCVFEWNYGDIKIIGSFNIKMRMEGESNKLALIPYSISYTFFPTAIEVSNKIKEIIQSSKEVSKKVTENSAQGF